VELKTEPQKIVSLTPGETEILFAIGAGDRVVATAATTASSPPEPRDLPVVGTFNGVDVEKIVGAGTDLVIAGGSGGTPPDAISKLRSRGVPVLVVYAADVSGLIKDVALTGAATGQTAEAADLAATMKAGFDQIATSTAGVSKPRVFYETGDNPSIFGIADQQCHARVRAMAC